jgi:hypothetical protein
VSALPAPRDEIAVTTWIKQTLGTSGAVFSRLDVTDGRIFAELSSGEGAVKYRWIDGAVGDFRALEWPVDVADGLWHHLVLSLSSVGESALFVDGEEVAGGIDLHRIR